MKTSAILAISAMYANGLTLKEDGVVAATTDAIVDGIAVEATSIEGAIIEAETNEAISASIDGVIAAAGADGEAGLSHEHLNNPVPDNYRPPPVQDIQRRERRERPDIHNHGLLNSMDLSFVNGGFSGRSSGMGGMMGGMGGGYQQQQQQQQPQKPGPIGFLGTRSGMQSGAGNGMMGQYNGLGAGVGGYGGYQAPQQQQQQQYGAAAKQQ